jgi:periplasmic protein TonB
VNRTAVAIGLGLSLLLHSGLFLLSVRPSDPLAATQLKVTLQQILPQAASETPSSPPSRTENPQLPEPVVQQPEPVVQKPEPVVNPKPKRQPIRTTRPPRDIEPFVKPTPRSLPEPRTVTTPVRQKVEPRPALLSPEFQPAAAPVTSPPALDRVASIPTETTEQITPPTYIPRKPPYPRLAEQRGWEGTVQLKVVISPEGRVSNASIQHSSGYQVLDRSALQHIRNSRFRPARKNGKAIEMSILLPIVYELR